MVFGLSWNCQSIEFGFQFCDKTVKLIVNVMISLVLLQQYDHRHDLHWEQAGGIPNGCPMLQDGLKEYVKNKLITTAKCIIERPQFGKLVEDDLRCGRKSAAHTC